jgi:hypothetical protein
LVSQFYRDEAVLLSSFSLRSLLSSFRSFTIVGSRKASDG